MKIVWNVLLGLLSAGCAIVLLLQGFGLPPVGSGVLVLLRILGCAALQWLLDRTVSRKILRFLPAMAAGCFACWGFFLLLSSPSWRNATFGAFLADYASYLAGFLLAVALRWLLVRLVPRIKKAIRKKLHRRTLAKQHKQR